MIETVSIHSHYSGWGKDLDCSIFTRPIVNSLNIKDTVSLLKIITQAVPPAQEQSREACARLPQRDRCPRLCQSRWVFLSPVAGSTFKLPR